MKAEKRPVFLKLSDAQKELLWEVFSTFKENDSFMTYQEFIQMNSKLNIHKVSPLLFSFLNTDSLEESHPLRSDQEPSAKEVS